MREVKEILGEQLELLAEASKRTSTTKMELCDLSRAMVQVSETMKEPIALNMLYPHQESES